MENIKIDLGFIGSNGPENYHLLEMSSRRIRFNLSRKWNRLSRLQRNLIFVSVTLVLISLSLLLMSRRTNVLIDKNEHLIVVDGKVKEEPSVSIIDNSPKFTGPQNERQRAVVEAFRHAWKGYKRYAWGHDHLAPISKTYSDWFRLGLTIVDSLDTMLIMDLRQEFQDARSWVESSLNFDIDFNVNFFETTIRVLGGLLSAYHLNGNDELFLNKAVELGEKLKGGFDTPSKIPYPDVNLKSARPKLASWTTDSSLSEISTVQLEFRELSRVSGNPVYEDLAFNVSWILHKLGCKKHDGLCPMYVNPKRGVFNTGGTITIGARTDSFYEYLLKQWLQSGKTIDWLRRDYLRFVKGLTKHLLKSTYGQDRWRFVGELLGSNAFSPKMDHLVCFLPATLALGAYHRLPYAKLHLQYAKDLARTCHAMYNTKSGLAPEIVYFNMQVNNGSNGDEIFIKSADAHSLLRPEAVEAWFYLYRITGDPIYQQWGWDMFLAIEKHAKVEHGYSSVYNVKEVPVTHSDKMESFFLAETLKYLYLLFADDQSILPLDKFVFNTEAHPLPIHPNV